MDNPSQWASRLYDRYALRARVALKAPKAGHHRGGKGGVEGGPHTYRTYTLPENGFFFSLPLGEGWEMHGFFLLPHVTGRLSPDGENSSNAV